MQSTPYLLPLLIPALLSTLLAIVIWRRRQAPGALPLALLMLAVALWALAYLLSLASITLAASLFWANLAFLGIVLVPVSWLAFALIYSGHGMWLSPRRLLLLSIMPMVTLVGIWTNELHGLFRSNVFFVDTGSFIVLDATLGPLFWIHTAYSYVLLVSGTILLLRNLFRMSPAYRSQAGGLFIGVAAPWVGNVLYLSGLSPFPYLDLTPFALTISGIALTWDLWRFGLFNLVPIAHSTVFQSMSGGVLVLDGQDRIVDINPAALALIQRRLQDVIGQSVELVIPNRADIIKRYRQVSAAHEELVFDEDSDVRAFDLRISPIYDRTGKLEGRIIVLHDITERRRIAMELLRQNVELTNLARENTQLYTEVQQELAERKQAEVALSLAKEAAEVASRAKSRFLRNMSHELRTPLTAILGYANLIAMEARRLSHQELIGDITHIQNAGQHLLELISDVIDFTRIEAEKLDLRLEHFDVSMMVQQLADTIMPLVEKNGNTLQIECPADGVVMYADMTRVRQILLNVLGNAVKFTEHGHITLQVSLGASTPQIADDLPEADDSAFVIFQISDTGIGMLPEQQRQLFKEFVQVDDSTTRRHDGSGLGLAITNRLCQLMGGDISVISAPGQGSTFTIRLPLQVVMPAKDEQQRANTVQ